MFLFLLKNKQVVLYLFYSVYSMIFMVNFILFIFIVDAFFNVSTYFQLHCKRWSITLHKMKNIQYSNYITQWQRNTGAVENEQSRNVGNC